MLTPEQIDALADAANAALNDYYHADLCGCRTWPQECATAVAIPSNRYAPGYWDTSAFHIALPLIADLIAQAVTAAPDTDTADAQGPATDRAPASRAGAA
ncbi:hypothetical protein [Embleya sp. NPDC001921]